MKLVGRVSRKVGGGGLRGSEFCCTSVTSRKVAGSIPYEAIDLIHPLSSISYRGQENVDLYIHSYIRLHGIVLN
jgi:hypothetical protein